MPNEKHVIPIDLPPWACGSLEIVVRRSPSRRHGSARIDEQCEVNEPSPGEGYGTGQPAAGPVWSPASEALKVQLSQPLASRRPVGYQRSFVDAYRPNDTALLPTRLAQDLALLGRLPGRLPAGTYARKVLEVLLIDLSWSSSRLEGNTYSMLDTQQLFKGERAGTDRDAVMLLNHKQAIEYLVESVPYQGLTVGIVQSLHALLMHQLLADRKALGAVRHKLVGVTGSTYVPLQAPSVLQEMLHAIVEKARLIHNPLEAAFFLWVNIAYLQPFEDGNKRTSRLAANIPLMLQNQAPLSFLDVGANDYALSMLGIYEFNDTSMAVDLFEWMVRRSLLRYRAVWESKDFPDPFQFRHRLALADAVLRVVRGRESMSSALAALPSDIDDIARFEELLKAELEALSPPNGVRFRLAPDETLAWIEEGRHRSS